MFFSHIISFFWISKIYVQCNAVQSKNKIKHILCCFLHSIITQVSSFFSVFNGLLYNIIAISNQINLPIIYVRCKIVHSIRFNTRREPFGKPLLNETTYLGDGSLFPKVQLFIFDPQ